MRFKYYILFFLFVFSSCQDHMSLDDLQGDNQLVVYSFPTTYDTTEIQVSSTIPIKGIKLDLKDVVVNGYVNEKNKNIIFLRKEESNSLYELVYYFTDKLYEGDRISINVKADGMKTVNAATTIPECPKIENAYIEKVYSNGDFYDQIRLTMKNPSSTDYFAVRVIGEEKEDTSCYNKVESIETSGEPVLNNYTIGESSFNTSNDFYHNFYIFDNTAFKNDTTYTLHLNMLSKEYINRYKVQLYHLSSDFFFFIKSINDTKNNEFGDYGLSFVKPTYTNIANGVGVVGGYSVMESNWMVKRKGQ